MDSAIIGVATVEVKSAWWSKINWTQFVAFASSMLTVFLGSTYAIPPEIQVQIIAAIQGAQALATWVMKTWFTPTVTPQSIQKGT